MYGKQRGTVEEHVTIRAFLVEPGTFAAVEAAEAAKLDAKVRAAAEATILRYHDLAATLAALDRLRKSPRLVVAGGRDPVRGIEAIAEWLRGRGIELAAVNGYLDDKATRLDRAALAVVDAFGPLLVGHLSGQPLPCALKHKAPEPAWTLTAGGRMPICGGHLEPGR